MILVFYYLDYSMTYKSLKMIAVSEANYLALKKLGSAGDSFNDVVTEVLKQVEKNENKLSRTIPDRYSHRNLERSRIKS